MPIFARSNKGKKPSPSSSARGKRLSQSGSSAGTGTVNPTRQSVLSGGKDDDDDLGDLAEAFGDDYGHGFPDDAPDPNIRPMESAAPVLLAATPDTLSLGFKPQKQGLTRLVVQAMPCKKLKGGAYAFRNGFDSTTRAGGLSVTLSGQEAAAADKAVFVGLPRSTSYYARLVATNPGGTTEGLISGPHSTPAQLPDKLKPRARPSTGPSAAPAAAPASKLFSAPSGPARSKIWLALNPDKLYYEHRREKQETGKIVVGVRGGGRDYSRMQDADGSYLSGNDDNGNGRREDEAEGASGDEEEEDFDPNNLPDFGAFQAEMEEMRRRRAEKSDERRATLRAEHERKRLAEQARLDAELDLINAKKAREAAAQDLTDNDVREFQARLEREISFEQFSFRM